MIGLRKLTMLKVSTEQIDAALQALQDGGVIVYPTETSYALGCDARHDMAVQRIFKIKGRATAKALPVIVPDVASIKNYVEESPVLKNLAAKFWPGPLNIIAPVAEGSPISARCAKDKTQSVRVSSHPFAAILVKRFGFPIVATSANITGQDAIYEVKKIKQIFQNCSEKIDLFIDGGDLPLLPASTTVKVVDESHIAVVRQGKTIIPAEFL